MLSLENFLAGNHATYLLSMLGAEIIKIEQPGTGDALRNIGPYLPTDDGVSRTASEFRVMSNKESVCINMRSREGRELFLSLIEHCDVFFTNQKPSSLQKSMGITFHSLRERNPSIVYTTLSGFGHDDVVPSGPFGDWPAFDIIAQGVAGLQFRAGGEGDQPGYNGLALGDELTSILSVLGTVTALWEREKTGEAQRVDLAMHDAMVFINQLTLGTWTILDREPPRGRSGTSAPYGSFRTADGWVNIAVGGDAIWARFCAAIERPELATDPRYATSAGRTSRIDELDTLVTAWTTSYVTDEVVRRLHAHNVPTAPVYTTPQVAESPQVAARNMLVELEDPHAGTFRIVGNPIKMSALDADATPAPPPLLGSGTREILARLLGLSETALDDLERSETIASQVKPDSGAVGELS